VPSLARGGLARATLDSAQAVIAAGGRAIVASPRGAMVPDLLRLHATHLELPERRSAAWARFSLPSNLAASLRKVDVGVVQSRSPRTSWIAQALAHRLGVKSLATLHRPLSATDLAGRFLEARQCRADALVAVSDHVAADALKRFPQLGDRLETITPGINLDRFDPAVVRAERVIRLASELRVPDGSHVVLCPNPFDEDRGQKLLIEAIAKLGRDDVFCLLPGSVDTPTPFERELERAIEAAHLHGKVQIGPFVDDMPAAYMLADVVVATGGARRGFSRALIEAQAMGRPVVAEDGGGAAESVRAGITGWVAEAGDADALARAIGAALALEPRGRAELARSAQEHVRGRYGLADCSRRLLQLYDRLTEA
jgi:glycosyltransferase involved in cell wall biosynthesis